MESNCRGTLTFLYTSSPPYLFIQSAFSPPVQLDYPRRRHRELPNEASIDTLNQRLAHAPENLAWAT